MMGLRVEHEIHRRRRGRNIGLALVLAAFAAMTFALTIAKLEAPDQVRGYDYETAPAR